MNAFWSVANLSANKGTYLGSQVFRERIELQGEQGLVDKINILCSMLKRISLCPRQVRTSLRYLKNGTVMLYFFGYSNPIPMFEIDIEHPAFAQLRSAIAANLRSGKFNAAKRVIKWRGLANRNQRRIDQLITSFGLKLNWGEASMTVQERQELHLASRERLNAFADAVREKRHLRLRQLMVAACGTYGHTDLLTELSLEAMPG